MEQILKKVIIFTLLTGNNLHAEECPNARAVEEPCQGVLLPTVAANHALRCLTVDLPLAQDDLKLAQYREAQAQDNLARFIEQNAEPKDVSLWNNPLVTAVGGFVLGAVVVGGYFLLN